MINSTLEIDSNGVSRAFRGHNLHRVIDMHVLVLCIIFIRSIYIYIRTYYIYIYPRSPSYISKMFVPGTSISHKRPFHFYQTPSNCFFPSHGHHVYPSAEWFPLFGVGSQDLNMEGDVTLYYSCSEFMYFDQAFVRWFSRPVQPLSPKQQSLPL